MRRLIAMGGIIVLVGFSSIFVYIHYQPKKIDKSFKMVNLNSIYDNHKKVEMGKFGLEFKVDVVMSFNKSIFKGDTFKGILTINDDLEYKVISTTNLGDKYHLVFINNQSPNNYADLEFTLLQRNLFESVVINEVVINGQEYLLSGPANTIEEAIEKLAEFYPNDLP